jgi:hypothetical protein
VTSPTVRRIDRGSRHSYEIDGQPAAGATKALAEGFPKPALIGWASNVVADLVMDRWDELLTMAPSDRDRLLRRARYEYRDEAADRGKRAHTMIYQLARGAEVDVPDELKGYADAYDRFVEQWKPREVLLETPVFSFEFRYAGTLDVVADLADGQRWLLDWKTGKNVYPEVALQLAAYRYADVYLDANGETQPMIAVDACASVWVQDGVYTVRPVEVTPDTFAAFGAVLDVAAWRSVYDHINDGAVGAAIDPPTEED